MAKEKKLNAASPDPLSFAICLLTEAYLFLILFIYPFVFKPGYADTSRMKFGFLTGISYGFFFGPLPVPTFVPVALLLALIRFVKLTKASGKKDLKEIIRSLNLSLTDKFVLLYALSLILSSLVSSYKGDLLWGYPGWNMGLMSQFLFVCLYFICSRFFDPADLKFFVFVSMIASAVVFAIAVLQRLGFDILHLYTESVDKLQYLSTIGQASWFSSYMILFVVTGAFVVWFSDKKSILYKAGCAYLLLGSVCLVTQNTDSAYAGLFLALSLLFVWSFDAKKKMMRFLETSLIILLGFRIAGFLYMAAGEGAVMPDALSVFMMKSPFIWLLIAVLSAVYLWVRKRPDRTNGFDAGHYQIIAKVYIALLALGVLLLVLYIVFNSLGKLPESLSSANGYLLFNSYWGNNRGAAYHDTVLSVLAQLKKEPLKGLFGAGADQFHHVIATYVSEQTSGITAMTLTNAHNEWLTAYVNFGLFGGTVYLLVFLSAVVRVAKNKETAPYAMASGACVLAYMAHNLFCYQQYVCTPYIFLIMGIGERLIRIKTVSRQL